MAPSSNVFDSASGCWRVSSSILDMVLKSQSETSAYSVSSTERLRSCCGRFVTATEHYYFQRVRRIVGDLVESDQQSTQSRVGPCCRDILRGFRGRCRTLGRPRL